MRVLYVSKALVVAAYRAKLEALARAAEVVAIVPRAWGRVPLEEPDEGTVRLQRERTVLAGQNHLHFYPAMARVLDHTRPDLVHIDEEPYSAVTLHASQLCRARRIPCLFFAWQNLPKRLPPPFGLLRRRVYRTATGGIAGTAAAASVLRNSGFVGPLAVVPQFGVDEQRFRPDPEARAWLSSRLRAHARDLLVGFCGRLVPEKGISILVRALAELSQARLVVVGDGPQRAQLERLARELGITERITMVGHVRSTAMPSWMAGLDVLVLPSLSTRGWAEQFGRVLVEAMACGIPVVGSDSGEIPHVVGQAGIIVPEGDVHALATALRRLQGNRELHRTLARAGRARVLQEFTHERIAWDTLTFYDELLGRRAA